MCKVCLHSLHDHMSVSALSEARPAGEQLPAVSSCEQPRWRRRSTASLQATRLLLLPPPLGGGGGGGGGGADSRLEKLAIQKGTWRHRDDTDARTLTERHAHTRTQLLSNKVVRDLCQCHQQKCILYKCSVTEATYVFHICIILVLFRSIEHVGEE